MSERMAEAPMSYTTMESPVGELLLAGDEQALCLVSFPSGQQVVRPGRDWIRSEQPFAAATSQLSAFFGGELETFDLLLKPDGTAFQKRVWRALCKIPYGETRSYGWLAREIGLPNASRAVGAANGANPLPIVVPCHRVIGANGSLTGFGGGIEVKRFLLDLEARNASASTRGTRLL